MAAFFQRAVHRLTRRKCIDIASVSETKLARCLSTFDLTALGVGSTLGAGIYIVAGQVAHQTAGPAVILSFLIAAIASVFAGLCYAEFGARVPKTGSAYVYSYVTVGEFLAFVIGWNLVLEYVIGTASVARAWSQYFDSIVGNKIADFFSHTMPMHVNTLSAYPDFFAFGITLLLTVVLAIGVKESSVLNNIFTVVNLLVVTYVVICGLFKADIHNWSIPAEDVPIVANKTNGNGVGGFFPYGVSGMLSGAATCFYAFVGFDCIATTGEEVKNPQKAIPIAIIGSLLVCFLGYFGISAILTLMVPYYSISLKAPVPQVFTDVGWKVATYVITAGSLCGLSTSLLGAMFPMPRVIYAMASDGLLFKFLSRINERFRTPLYATICSGFLAGVMAMLFDLTELVNMMSIGTLLAYTLVAICVLILRYQPEPFKKVDDQGVGPHAVHMTKEQENKEKVKENKFSILDKMRYDQLGEKSDDEAGLIEEKWSLAEHLKEVFRPSLPDVNHYSAKVVKICVALLMLTITLLAILLAQGINNVIAADWWALLFVVVFVSIIIMLVGIIWRQPENKDCITFKVPLVALITSLSIFINVYLMMKLNYLTWIRFGVWNAIGWIIYFAYGIRHSLEEVRDQGGINELPDVTASPTRPLHEDSTLIQ